MNNFFFFFTFFPSIILLYDVVVNMSARTVSVVDKTVIVEESRSVLLCVLFFLWMSVCVNFCYVGEENQYSALAHLISFFICTLYVQYVLVLGWWNIEPLYVCNKDFLELIIKWYDRSFFFRIVLEGWF
jgi:hypothetical protein